MIGSINYSKGAVKLASQSNIAELLTKQGERVVRDYNGHVWTHDGVKVHLHGNVWYCHYEKTGGDTIAFVRKFYGLSFQDAVTLILKTCEQTVPIVIREEKPIRGLALPQKFRNYNTVFAYLMKKRGINRQIIHDFVHANMIYETPNYHDIAFVGYDIEGNPRHVQLRGTRNESEFRGNTVGSDCDFSFHWYGKSNKIFLFEAPIDMLSYITMNPKEWKKDSYAAACSVSDRVLTQTLKDCPWIDEINICFDNDDAGKRGAYRIAKNLKEKGYKCNILMPFLKDWNDDLLRIKSGVHVA